MRRSVLVAAAMLEIALAQTAFDLPALAQTQAVQPRNIVLFIADGLRFCMVDDNTAPTVAAMARQGVTLRNGHALFPTFTMANASGMATGHMLGDTGTYSNTIYTGFEVPRRGQ
jgi:predicted AlkP superfamily pyrophosphatase or phosphodiesterase